MNEWIIVTARIEVEYDEEYQRNLVVPHIQKLEMAEELKDDLVLFQLSSKRTLEVLLRFRMFFYFR